MSTGYKKALQKKTKAEKHQKSNFDEDLSEKKQEEPE